MKILYITYFYPPLGGPAALRNLKTVHYLADAGAEIHLITIRDIEYTYYDDSLIDKCREKALIRTGSLDPMAILKSLFKNKKQSSQKIYRQSPERLKLFIRRLYPIDEKIGWLPFLTKAGRKELKKGGFDLIFVSCGPFSAALGAYRLAEEFALPLVVDYRDYWSLLKDYDLMGNLLKRRYSIYWERKILARTNLLVSATKGIADELAQYFDSSLPERTFVLYNGHDEKDFTDLPKAQPSADYFSLAYFGNIYARRTLKYLYQAIFELKKELSTPQNLRIRLYGNFNKEVIQEIEDSGIKEIIEIYPQTSHREALINMQKQDALILIINSGSPKGTLTSKVFEYLRLQRPILALVPPFGEAAALLKECGNQYICPMESVSGIKRCLTELFQLKERPESIDTGCLEKYERGAQVKALFERMNEVVK